MRIATWNVNGLRARSAYLEAWLEEVQPDIVGLQELKMQDAQFPQSNFEERGYHAYAHGQKSWNGVAILSKEPLEITQRGLPDAEELGARLIAAKHPLGFEFITVYCPNGKSIEHEDYARKLGWFDKLHAFLHSKCTEQTPLVVCGDFNIVPDPVDSWNEELFQGSIFHTKAERQRFQSLRDLGLHDLYREKYPDQQSFTWWDYRGGAFHKGHGLRIDLVLSSRALADSVEDVFVERTWRKKLNGWTPSDHAPVCCDISADSAV
ncbi:MAG: exodeoxyribonuclease III [Myxococcota bacterium]